ncbi:uncharacterized protein TRIADDRAFT_63614 [Trichoplax adhaerens]|uniref:Expressed protein n=1 Tax=Trichoplax adhaerens TaxID=10228 RepID=B3RN48_TRIAD|nr:expressed protein [Trichoplax adhaerens]EDV27392.1 expressed protein [Trichoplax adhaerens]|eukprot:XP_002109226.1 expressed protein [Trichoplax adhaerens]
MMMRQLLTLTALFALSSACCLPRQYSVLLASGTFNKYSSSISQYGAINKVYYDQCNQRIRYNNPTAGFSFITDYGSNEYHSIRNGTCTTFKLRGSLKRTCTPSSFHYMKTLNFGAGALPFDILSYKRFGSTYSSGASYFISNPGCIPISYSGFYKSKTRSSLHGVVWLNFTIGISDLSVFNAPKFCRSTRTLKSMENFDIWDFIAKDFGQETKNPEEMFNTMHKETEQEERKPENKVEIKPERNDDFDGKKFLRENFGLGDFDFEDSDDE